MFVDKLPDTANLSIGGLVFGQVLAVDGFSVRLPLLGVGLWALFMALALLVARKEER
jgi:hypothetical protein